MKKEIQLTHISLEKTFEKYELKFKAIADKKKTPNHEYFNPKWCNVRLRFSSHDGYGPIKAFLSFKDFIRR